MRRQAEGLIILSGAAPGRAWRQPVPVIEVLRGALGEIEDFARVDLITDSPDFLQGRRRRRRDPPARRAGGERRALLPARHPRPGQVRPGGQRVRDRGRGPWPRHSRRHPGRAERPARQAAGVRPGRQRPARAVRGQPPRRQARDQGLAARVGLRRDAGGGAPPAFARRIGGRDRLRRGAATQAARAPAARRPRCPPEWPRDAGTRRSLRRAPGSPAGRGPAPRAGARGRAGGARRRQGPRACRSGSRWPAWRRNCARSRRSAPKGPLAGRSPDQARALLSSIRQGWRNGLSAGGAGDDEHGARPAESRNQGRTGQRMSGGTAVTELDWLLENLAGAVDGIGTRSSFPRTASPSAGPRR